MVRESASNSMSYLKKMLLTCWALIAALALQAQIVNPVHFTSELKTGEDAEAEIVFHAKIDAGWHVYSTDLGSGGPTEATFNVVKMDGAEPVGKLTPKGKVIKKMDKLFDMELKYFENEATFVQKIRFTKPDYDIDCYLEYGACSDASCLPPKSPVPSAPNAADKKTEDVAKAAPAATDNPLPEETVPTVAKNDTAKVDSTAISNHAVADDLWMPVTDELRALGSGEDLAKQSLLWLLLMGFVAGLLAVCMPCIWPIIPMTVSFFLKRSKDDKKKPRCVHLWHLHHRHLSGSWSARNGTLRQ